MFSTDKIIIKCIIIKNSVTIYSITGISFCSFPLTCKLQLYIYIFIKGKRGKDLHLLVSVLCEQFVGFHQVLLDQHMAMQGVVGLSVAFSQPVIIYGWERINLN